MADNTCPEGWVITLVKIRPACRMARGYRVEVRAALFVPCGVVCTWGSLVTRYARFRVLPCETWESAVQLA